MNENIEKIKKDNKKAKRIFVLIIIISTIGGGILGGTASYLGGKGVVDYFKEIGVVLSVCAPYLAITILISATVATQILYTQARRLYTAWTEDDDEGMKKIEYKLSIALSITSIVMILDFFLFPVGMVGLDNLDPYSIIGVVGLVLALGSLILSMIYITVFQRRIIDFEREMNPEKQGSIYEMRFADKWESSCDEAEKLIIYHAGYKAYKTTSYWCMGLWLVCVIGLFSFDFGILPVTIVSALWLVMTVSYLRNSIKFSKYN